MIGLVLAALLSSAPTDIPGVNIYEGKCDYPAELGPKKPGEMRLECDMVVVTPSKEPNSLLVQFAAKAGGMPVGFAGDVDDSGTLSIRRIYLKPGNPTPASRGHCRIFHSANAVSGITCVGFIGEQAIVANFRAFAP